MRKFIISLLFSFFALVSYANNLTCLELDYNVSELNHSSKCVEYFYIDSQNQLVYDSNKIPVDSVELFTDKVIKFQTRKSANDPIYDIVIVYTIDRYTGGVTTSHQSIPRTFSAKAERFLFSTVQNVTFGNGSGTVKKIDKPLQKF